MTELQSDSEQSNKPTIYSIPRYSRNPLNPSFDGCIITRDPYLWGYVYTERTDILSDVIGKDCAYSDTM